MEWILKVVRDNYANFNGRARRKEFWMFFLFNFIISFVFGLLAAFSSIFTYVSYVVSLALFVPYIAVGIRRMHDVGKSGWFILIPIYNLVLFCTDGDRGTNEYGEDPKGGENGANPFPTNTNPFGQINTNNPFNNPNNDTTNPNS